MYISMEYNGLFKYEGACLPPMKFRPLLLMNSIVEMMMALSIDNLPELLTVEETRQVLGLKTTQTIYRKIYKGELNAVKIGRMVRIPKSSIHSLISGTAEQKSSIFKEGNPSRLSPAPQRRRKLEWEI